MNSPFITALFLTGFLLLNVKIIMQLKKISLFHQISKMHILFHPVIIIIFSMMAVYLAETLLDYTVFMSAAVALILSIYNKGFTEKGIFPMVIGGTLRNMIGHEFKYDQTRDWLIMEQKKRVKVRFTVDHNESHESVFYVYFDKEKKETIESLLYSHNLPVSVELNR